MMIDLDRLRDCTDPIAAKRNTGLIKDAAEEIEKLRDALRFYRDGFVPSVGKLGVTYTPSEQLLDDCGNRAREAMPS